MLFAAFLIGLLIGGCVGVFAMCLCVAAGSADAAREREENRR